MPLNPLISLGTQTPDIGRTFSNVLTSLNQFEDLKQAPARQALLDAQVQGAQDALPTDQQKFNQAEQNRLTSVVQGAFELNSIPQGQRLEAATQRRKQLIDAGLPTQDTDRFIAAMAAGDTAGAQSMLDKSIQLGTRLGIVDPLKTKTGLASAKTEIFDDGTVIQALPDSSVEVRNPLGEVVTGQERLDTLAKSQQFRESTLRTESKIEVDKAREIAGAKSRQTRISDIQKEFSDSSRIAARSDIKLRQAELLIGQASQGITGELQLKLGKLFPDIDASDEGALTASLQGLALDELQKFKGPTTDFEFGVTQSISGALGDPKTANLARIKSLQRNNWFVKREGEQFRRHVKAGGDPDNFTFNFGEPVKTKKGVFTLRDLQDTAVENNISVEDVIKQLNK